MKKLSKPLVRLACAVALMGAFGTSVAQSVNPSTQELLNKAGTFQILLDVSGSSPATDEKTMRAIAPKIIAKLREMPIGTKVSVTGVGDARTMPLVWVKRVQARVTPEGAPMEDLARGLQQLLIGFPKRIEHSQQNYSELVGGFFDASKNLNPRAEINRVLVVSDLLEHTQSVNCFYATRCKLPDPKFSLRNAEVIVYGVGMGLPSDRAMSLERLWADYLSKKAFAKSVELHRF
jgi:hypothetical protein